MKRMKKFVGLLLTMMLVLGMVTTALAATGNGKITINNTVNGKEYKIYRIFNLESFNSGTKDPEGNITGAAYSYKVNEDWKSFFATGAEGLNYVTVDANGYVTWKSEAKAADFAEKAIAFATSNSIAVVGNETASGDDTPVVFENLPLGYYLVDSSLGTLCALTTTDPTAEVIEKNSKPSLEKWVKEDDWQKNNDANIGDEVEFKAVITVQGYANSYVMHDKMDDGLTYKEVTKIVLNENETEEKNLVKDTDYTVETTNTDSCTFEVKFKEAFCESLKSGDVITVYYKATLNDNAVVKAPENNNAHLSYKDNNDTDKKTEDSNTKTYTWEMPVLKYANSNEETPLAGAKFSLYTDSECTKGNEIKFHEVKKAGATTVYRVDKAGSVTEITTDATGKFNLEGLDAGTYYLKETEAPEGYNKLDTVVKVVISSEKDNTEGAAANELVYKIKQDVNGALTQVDMIKVNNQSGTLLPSTGGMGTTMFYVVGAILVVAAVVLLVTKRRMNND